MITLIVLIDRYGLYESLESVSVLNSGNYEEGFSMTSGAIGKCMVLG